MDVFRIREPLCFSPEMKASRSKFGDPRTPRTGHRCFLVADGPLIYSPFRERNPDSGWGYPCSQIRYRLYTSMLVKDAQAIHPEFWRPFHRVKRIPIFPVKSGLKLRIARAMGRNFFFELRLTLEPNEMERNAASASDSSQLETRVLFPIRV